MNTFERRKTHAVRVGSLLIGGNAPISIQSMTNTDTCDADATYRQVRELENAGCEIVRLAVPSIEAARTFASLKEKGIRVPLVADIHFDYRIALECVAAGADKIRINPGNIGDDSRVRAVTDACRAKNIPIRIGVNGGSLEKEILKKHGAATPMALAESAMYHISLLERFDFHDTVVSVKASNVHDMIEANRILAEKTDCPLHLGVTEAGSERQGRIRSAVGIGALLAEGIGDTVRVSLSADPVREIGAAKDILDALGLLPPRLRIVSCPTCGRTRFNMIPLLETFEEAIEREGLSGIPCKVAFMGCAVNGPGEARDADVGIAGGINEALLFKHGEIVCKLKEDEVVSRLIDEVRALGK